MFFIFIFFIFSGLAFFTIRCTVTKDWNWYTILISIGLFCFCNHLIIKEIEKVRHIFPLLIYLGLLLVLLLVLYLVSPKRKIKRNPGFKKSQEIFRSSQDASTIYVCLDGVAICSDTNPYFNREQLYEKNISSTAWSKWLYSEETVARYSVATIPNSIVIGRIYYKDYGYANIGEELPRFTKLLAKSLKLNYYLFEKFYYTPEQTYKGMPTGAIISNGIITFTGTYSSDPAKIQKISYIGELSIKKIEKPKKEEKSLKSW